MIIKIVSFLKFLCCLFANILKAFGTWIIIYCGLVIFWMFALIGFFNLLLLFGMNKDVYFKYFFEIPLYGLFVVAFVLNLIYWVFEIRVARKCENGFCSYFAS